VVNLAKLSTNGQVTLPVEVRRRLHLVPGDKVLFAENSNGEIVVANAAATVLVTAQRAFAGAADDFGATDEDGVQRLVDEVRGPR
jgi:AbrB family looped-hinge helix DNA binding protein